MGEIVKYANDFNYLEMPNLTEREMNIFIKIISRLKNSRTITVDAADFLGDLRNREESYHKIIEIFRSFARKIIHHDMAYTDRYGDDYVFVCFERLIFRNQTNAIEITAQENFYALITDYRLGFTHFELLEFIELKGKYTKTLYRLLKQFRSTGRVLVFKNKWDKFCKIMQIPINYIQGKIDERILKPAIKELSIKRDSLGKQGPIFENLTYKKIKDTNQRGQGGRVIGIEFYFTPERTKKDQNEFESMPKSKGFAVTETIYFKTEAERSEYLRNKSIAKGIKNV